MVTDGLFHLAFCTEKLNSIQNQILKHPFLISYINEKGTETRITALHNVYFVKYDDAVSFITLYLIQ